MAATGTTQLCPDVRDPGRVFEGSGRDAPARNVGRELLRVSEESVSAMVTVPAISAGSIVGLAREGRFVLVHSGHFIQHD